jgi:predicted metalloprotease
MTYRAWAGRYVSVNPLPTPRIVGTYGVNENKTNLGEHTMDIDGQRRSDNFEDRGAGSGRGGGGGGGGARLLSSVYRRFGFKGILVAGVLVGGVYLFAPDSIRQSIVGTGGGQQSAAAGASSVCDASEKNGKACDFSRAVLASTEDVWTTKFSAGQLPDYGANAPRNYPEPTLVVFANAVSTGGCGNATSATGPFYCPGDKKLYIDPSFYDTLASRLNAPGDFAQAYVIAHEVGHHIQNEIGSLKKKVGGETKEQQSVRVELQADCLAGVWGHSARADLSITDEALGEATQAAHSIGDDALGHSDKSKFTHGSSEQRIRWFKRGFDTGDPLECDTFAVKSYDAL